MPHSIESVIINIGIPQIVLMSWAAILFIIIFSAAATHKLSLVPGNIQNALEIFIEFVYGLIDDVIGTEGKDFRILFLGLFLYIFFGNLLGLIPGFSSPTASLSTTAALAVVVFISTHFFGIKRQGLKKYFNHFFHGVPLWLRPLMFIIELIGELARPLSLSFRLFGNIMAKEMLLGILALLVVIFFPSHNIVQKALAIVPFILRPVIILLGVFVSFIQAFVFTILSMLYIGGAIKTHKEVN